MGVNTLVVVVAQSVRLDWQLTANFALKAALGELIKQDKENFQAMNTMTLIMVRRALHFDTTKVEMVASSLGMRV